MKPEIEFTGIEDVTYVPAPGNVPGLTMAILAEDPEHDVVTRILKFEPGTDTSANGVQVHDSWEEVFIFEGSFTDLELGRTFTAPCYAVRPPGMKHGPWRSETGARMFEVRYRRKEDA
ncbi:cupin domain-containing protein [Streptomyces sp. NPDC006367]|uniref:cupin domain-containing protein n=1 Tax=unclassified Streptomyces TaxID=2593676 RepID=UPI0033AA2631